jgi:hypothetical protein
LEEKCDDYIDRNAAATKINYLIPQPVELDGEMDWNFSGTCD